MVEAHDLKGIRGTIDRDIDRVADTDFVVARAVVDIDRACRVRDRAVPRDRLSIETHLLGGQARNAGCIVDARLGARARSRLIGQGHARTLAAGRDRDSLLGGVCAVRALDGPGAGARDGKRIAAGRIRCGERGRAIRASTGRARGVRDRDCCGEVGQRDGVLLDLRDGDARGSRLAVQRSGDIPHAIGWNLEGPFSAYLCSYERGLTVRGGHRGACGGSHDDCGIEAAAALRDRIQELILRAVVLEEIDVAGLEKSSRDGLALVVDRLCASAVDVQRGRGRSVVVGELHAHDRAGDERKARERYGLRLRCRGGRASAVATAQLGGGREHGLSLRETARASEDREIRSHAELAVARQVAVLVRRGRRTYLGRSHAMRILLIRSVLVNSALRVISGTLGVVRCGLRVICGSLGIACCSTSGVGRTLRTRSSSARSVGRTLRGSCRALRRSGIADTLIGLLFCLLDILLQGVKVLVGEVAGDRGTGRPGYRRTLYAARTTGKRVRRLRGVENRFAVFIRADRCEVRGVGEGGNIGDGNRGVACADTVGESDLRREGNALIHSLQSVLPPES